MAQEWPPWFKAGGVGCLAVSALSVVVVLAVYAFVRLSGERDIHSREALSRVLPDASSFTPAGDRSLAPERLEAFLAVRRRLAVHCQEFAGIESAFARMDSYDGSAGSPSAAESDPGGFARDLGRALKAFVSVARRLGAYLETRNRTLLEEGMGLGEFTWIQVVAYHAWLGEPTRRFVLARPDEPRVFQDRVVPQVREMIRRHLAASERAGAPGIELAPWRRELAALDRNPERVPFADGPPPALAGSLEPYREALRSVWCPATQELDLVVTVRDGLGFEHL